MINKYLKLPEKRHSVNKKALKAWSDAKFGLFIHWGIYSIPAGIWNGKKIERLGEQIQRHAAIPREEYAKLASEFNPINFNASEIAKLAKNAGMRYIVITAKHHDGFCMFKSEYTDFNIVDATPYGKDLLKELANACAEEGLKFGVYFSNPDWNYPGAVERERGQYTVFEEFTPEHLEFSINQLRELLTNYGPIFEVFFDMGLSTLEESVKLAEVVHDCQPDCLVSGRVMNNQGDFLTLPDNHLPETTLDQPWETPCTFYHTWGYKSWIDRPPAEEQFDKQIKTLSEVIGMGGNYLLNIGPLSDGSILPYEKEMLERMGKWVIENKPALFNTDPAPFPKLPWGNSTVNCEYIYLHVENMPEDGKLIIPGLNNDITAELLADGTVLPCSRDEHVVIINMSGVAPNGPVTIIRCKSESNDFKVDPPAVVQNGGDIELDESYERSQGFYNSLQYNTNIQNVKKSWDLYLEKAGTYQVSLEYQLNQNEMSVVLSADEQSLSVILSGKKTDDDEGFSDGNEIVSKNPGESPVFSTRIGEISFKTPRKLTLELVKNSDAIQADGLVKNPSPSEPWNTSKTWIDTRKAKAKTSLQGLKIKKIRLVKNI